MLIVGLTGGIATGKTTVANMFKKRGAKVIDADKIGHKIMRPKTEIWQQIVDSFGKGILNKDLTIDRTKLGKIVFPTSYLLKELNEIMHSKMAEVIKEEIAKITVQFSNQPTFLILEAAILLEANWASFTHKVIVVKASEKNQIARLKKNVHLSAEEAKARIAQQMPFLEKMQRADYLINNDDSLEKTEKQVEKLGELFSRKEGII